MLVTFSALHEAKRDGTLAQTLAAMTPAERVEAAQVCAANSTRTVSEWLTTFGELVEAAGYAVYCEACGVAVDPDAAVLDGELMVCQGCAPCSATEFEAMQMAEAKRLMAAELAALVPDPQTWVAVNEAACEPVACNVCGSDGSPCVECNPVAVSTPPGAVESIIRAELFDALCSSIDELRDYWRDVPRRLKALNDAWEAVVLAEAFWFDAQGNLLVESESHPGTWHAVGHTCPCEAGRWGNHCRHATVADLIGRARRIARLKAA